MQYLDNYCLNQESSEHSTGTSSTSSNHNSSSDFLSKQPPVCQSLVCVICHDVFKRPTSLRCGHTFCYNCIREYFSQTERSCPICRRQYSVSYTLSPNLVAQQVTGELQEYYRQSRQEKHEMETMRRFLLSSNHALQKSLDLHETSLEESKRLFNTLELQSSQELSKVEAQLQTALHEKQELEESNEVLRVAVQQLQEAQEKCQSNYEVLALTLREEIQTRYTQLSRSEQEKIQLHQQVHLLGEELLQLRRKTSHQDARHHPEKIPTFPQVDSSPTNGGLSQLLEQLNADQKKRPSPSFMGKESGSSSASFEFNRHRRQHGQLCTWIWTAVVVVFQALSEFPVCLGHGLGRVFGDHETGVGTMARASAASTPSATALTAQSPPATKAIQKVLNVLYVIWLLWIFQSICVAATQ